MKQRLVSTAVGIVGGVALLVCGGNPALAGPTSGGRSHGANAWGGGSYTNAAPVYVVPGSYAIAPTTINGGFYYAPETAPADGIGNAAVISVKVPANAEIWLNDYKTKITGPAREFISPPLSGDMAYRYHVRVRWMENGHEVVQERDVPVAPGTRTNVQFAGLGTASAR
jgi:uncharacterized protein (TIGR03000 family)